MGGPFPYSVTPDRNRRRVGEWSGLDWRIVGASESCYNDDDDDDDNDKSERFDGSTRHLQTHPSGDNPTCRRIRGSPHCGSGTGQVLQHDSCRLGGEGGHEGNEGG